MGNFVINKKSMLTAWLAVLTCMTSVSVGQTIVASEDFDGGDVNMIMGFDENLNFDGFGFFYRYGVWNISQFQSAAAPFTLTDDSVANVSGNGMHGPDCEGIFGSARDPQDSFFTACSIDCFFEPNEANRTGTWLFDVSSASSDLTLSIDMGQLSADFFDGVPLINLVNIEYRFDSGAYQPAFILRPFELVGLGFSFRPMDSGNAAGIDTFGDSDFPPATAGTHFGLAAVNVGVTKTLAENGNVAPFAILDKSDPNTGEMDTYSIDLNGSGSTLELRVIVDFSFEAFALDNIVIFQEGVGILKGDVNQDGAINLLDVGPFIDLLDTLTYQAEADCNCDGVLNLLDVGPFIKILGNGG